MGYCEFVSGMYMSYRLRRWCMTLIALFVFAWVLVATSSAQAPATTGECPPPASPATSPSTATGLLDPAPERVLACVGSHLITGATFSHWADIARRSGSKHPLSAKEVTNEVMGFLVSSDWLLGEAADLGVRVSGAEVRHTFEHIRDQQFPKRREFKSFLKGSGETIPDLLFRVRLNLLSTRIQRHVLAGHRGIRNRQHALGGFVHEFKLKWTAQTYCEPGYATSDCGHVQASL
jgi:hypothetical protein